MGAYIKIIRLPFLLAIVAAQLIVHYQYLRTIIGIEQYDMPNYLLAIMCVTTLFIAAGGFVINDYYDLRIDEINRPLTRIVGNEITKNTAMNMYIAFTAVAICLSVIIGIITKSLGISLVYMSMIGLLWFYSSSYKRILFLGNILFAASTTMSIVSVAILEQHSLLVWWANQLEAHGYYVNQTSLSMADPTVSQMYKVIGILSVLIFVWCFILDLIRNFEEEKGETEMECHTIPIVYGRKTGKIMALSLIFVANMICIYMLLSNFNILHSVSIQYYVLTTFAFSVALSYFVYNCEHRRDCKICKNLVYINILFCVCFGFLYTYLKA